MTIKRIVPKDTEPPLPRGFLEATQSMGLLAYPEIPRLSHYRKWVRELNEKEWGMPVWKYAKLYARLCRLPGEPI